MTIPQIGDIGFLDGNGLIDRVIEFFDHGNYSHCFISMPEDSILESQYLSNTQIVTNRFNESDVTYLSLNLTDEQKDKLIHTSFTYLEDKYDVKQIFGILLHSLFNWNTNVSWNSKRKLICSELIVNILKDINYISDKEHYLLKDVTPNELYDYLIQRQHKSA